MIKLLWWGFFLFEKYANLFSFLTSTCSAFNFWLRFHSLLARIVSLTHLFTRCGRGDGHCCHGNVQVQSWDGPEGLLQSLPLCWPSSNGRPTHLHAVALDRPSWLLLLEVWSLCPPFTCPDQVTCCRPIREKLHLLAFANYRLSMALDSLIWTLCVKVTFFSGCTFIFLSFPACFVSVFLFSILSILLNSLFAVYVAWAQLKLFNFELESSNFYV